MPKPSNAERNAHRWSRPRIPNPCHHGLLRLPDTSRHRLPVRPGPARSILGDWWPPRMDIGPFLRVLRGGASHGSATLRRSIDEVYGVGQAVGPHESGAALTHRTTRNERVSVTAAPAPVQRSRSRNIGSDLNGRPCRMCAARKAWRISPWARASVGGPARPPPHIRSTSVRNWGPR